MFPRSGLYRPGILPGGVVERIISAVIVNAEGGILLHRDPYSRGTPQARRNRRLTARRASRTWRIPPPAALDSIERFAVR